MNNETKLGLAAVSAFAVFCSSANAAPAALVNQGYESGLAGWTSTGDVTATSDSSVVNNNGEWIIAPYQTQMAQLNRNSSSGGDPDLDTFFGLDAGTIDAAVGGDVSNGAGIQQSFTGLSGETVTQFWDYVARDYSPYNDPAFVVINGEVTTLASIYNGGIEVGDFGHSGWQSFSYTLPADGTYTIGFGVVNTADFVLPGALFLDNQAGDARFIPAIPEPGTYAMLLAGLGLLGFMVKRKNLPNT